MPAAPSTTCSQLRSALAPLAAHEVADVLVAYEPVWAIGTAGRAAEPHELAPAVAALAAETARLGGGPGLGARALLYGGSVDPATAQATLAVPGVDGLFVGRAAWEVDGLLAIARTAQTARTARTAPPDTTGGDPR